MTRVNLFGPQRPLCFGDDSLAPMGACHKSDLIYPIEEMKSICQAAYIYVVGSWSTGGTDWGETNHEIDTTCSLTTPPGVVVVVA